jgi:hypothetical protein
LIEPRDKKGIFYAPAPLLKIRGPKQLLPPPPALYEALTYDIEKMKALWSEIVEFKAPDVVGKIAPEIKPGKYTYKDVANNQQFKELIAPYLMDKIAPAGLPFVGNLSEFEIVPTRQYSWALPLSVRRRKRTRVRSLRMNRGIMTIMPGEAAFPQNNSFLKTTEILATNRQSRKKSFLHVRRSTTGFNLTD